MKKALLLSILYLCPVVVNAMDEQQSSHKFILKRRTLHNDQEPIIKPSSPGETLDRQCTVCDKIAKPGLKSFYGADCCKNFLCEECVSNLKEQKIERCPWCLTLTEPVTIQSSSIHELIDSSNKQLRFELHKAILNNSYEDVMKCIKELKKSRNYELNSPSDFCGINNNNHNILEKAILLARSEAVRALLENGAHIGHISHPSLLTYPSQPTSIHPVHASILLGDIKSATLLLKYKIGLPVEANARTETIRKAFRCFSHSPEDAQAFVEELFAQKFINSRGDIIGGILQNNSANVWRFALQTDDGISVLSRPLVLLFLRNGLNPNTDNIDSTLTPLGLAIQNSCLRSIAILLDAGAESNKMFGNPETRQHENTTPLAFAIARKKQLSQAANPEIGKLGEEIVQYLQGRGAKIR